MQVLGTSGLWEVMTAQEAVDFVHQCRHCRPDTLSCSQALTLEAHTRWKFKFSKVTNLNLISIEFPGCLRQHPTVISDFAVNKPYTHTDCTLRLSNEQYLMQAAPCLLG